jgi:hypothetical protein
MKNKKPADAVKPAFDWPIPSSVSKSIVHIDLLQRYID